MREHLQQLGAELSATIDGAQELVLVFDITDHDVLFVFRGELL